MQQGDIVRIRSTAGYVSGYEPPRFRIVTIYQGGMYCFGQITKFRSRYNKGLISMGCSVDPRIDVDLISYEMDILGDLFQLTIPRRDACRKET